MLPHASPPSSEGEGWHRNLAEHLRELGDEFERHGLALVVAIRDARTPAGTPRPVRAATSSHPATAGV